MIRQGDVLNDTYLIEEQLGAGGGGIVYKAYHQRLETNVVVKQIKNEVKGRIEGRSEADVLKRLRHSNLPRVYDFLEIDGEVYTVMDYIPGMDLKEAMLKNGGRFGQKQVLAWARELAGALAYLHGMTPPIIHSDIKPANIMLQPDGHICLIDFNVSLAFDYSARTSTGVSAGFSPPEQYRSRDVYLRQNNIAAELAKSFGVRRMEDYARTVVDNESYDETILGATEVQEQGGEYSTDIGDAGETYIGRREPSAEISVDPSQSDLSFLTKTDSITANVLEMTIGRGVDERSDIYSLGATLYMLLTGIKPSSRYWENIPIDQVVCADRSRIEISEGFALIIKKMMATDPANRYQNGVELNEAFSKIYELDNAYKKYKAKARVRWGVIAALFAASAGLLTSGYFVMQKERGNEYNREVLEAREAIAASEYDYAEEMIISAKKLITERVDAYEVEMQRLYALEHYEECIHYGIENINSPVYAVTTDSDKTSLANMFYLLGNAYYETGDYKNAGKSFELAISTQSGNGIFYRDLAISQAKQGNVDDAEETLKTARSLGIGEDSIFMTEGEIAYAKQNYTSAVELFQQVIAITDNDETFARTVLLCAEAYRRLDSSYYPEQIRFLETYEHETGSRGAQLTEMLAEVYAKSGEREKSIQKFEELIEKGYSSFQTYENLSILQQESGDFDKAKATLTTMDDLYPQRYETYKRLAFLEADIQSRKENSQRDYHQMKKYFDMAVALCSTDDVEMQRLSKLMDDIRSGGWL